MKRICVINFSSRANGNCNRIADYVVAYLKSNISSCQIRKLDFSAACCHSCGNCNYECFDNICDYIGDDIYEMYRSLLSAELVISVIPIYSGLPCSNYFVMSERIQGAFVDQEFDEFDNLKNKYIVIGNTGTQITKDIIAQNNENIHDQDFLFIQSNDVGERSIKGNLIEFDYFKKQINRFLKTC